jgi:hypothetical protein
MRSSLPVILAAAILLVPRNSAASLIDIAILEPTLEFGTSGARLLESTFRDIYLDGVWQPGPGDGGFVGAVEFDSAPLLSLTVSDDGQGLVSSRYEFGPGTLTLTAFWNDKFGSPAQGSFVAPLLGLTIDLCEQQLSTSDCGDVFGESGGDALADFGTGVFDESLASALRIGRSGDLSPFRSFIDGVTGDPSDRFRLGGSSAGQEEMQIDVELPEPSALSLLLLSPIAAMRFRRMRSNAR